MGSVVMLLVNLEGASPALPDGVREPREPVYYERLCREQDYSYFNRHEISGPGDDPERNDHGGRTGRRMADAQKHHDGPGE